MSVVNTYRARAVTGAPRPDPKLLVFMLMVVEKMVPNPLFSSVATLLTELSDAAVKFDKAIKDKKEKKGAGDALTSARQEGLNKLDQVKNAVNAVIEKMPVDEAKAVIESTGFRARKRVDRTRLPLAAKYGGTVGSVLLVAAAAAKEAVYYFQLSPDQKSWTSAPNSMKCKMLFTGLTVGATYYFRVQTQTRKGGVSDWSAPVSFMAR